MAEEKKPKIDLKARLGKMAVGGQTPPPPVSAGAIPAPGASVPAPPMAPPSIPAAVPPPPGVPVGPSPFGAATPPEADPSNPLVAAAGYRPQPVAPAQPQRIEIDESLVEQARKDARKKALVAGAVASILFLGVGFVVGRGAENGDNRKKSQADARDLASHVTTAREQLNAMATKLETARDQLVKERKFPDTLANELGGMNVNFDGSELAGRRFTVFPNDVTFGLTEFVTGVQALNDRKTIVVGLLNKLKQPLTEMLSAPAGQQVVSQVVVVDKDPAGNATALIAPLASPITFTPPKVELPDEFTFLNPIGSGNAKLPRYKGGDIATKPAALYVMPKTFERVCPSEVASMQAQLSAQLGGMIREIRGEQTGNADVVVDTKPGLVERADRLVTGLNKVGGAS
jgi:hypothetical protein